MLGPCLIFCNYLAEEDSWLLYFNCAVATCVLCSFLMMSLVISQQFVIVTFPGQTYL